MDVTSLTSLITYSGISGIGGFVVGWVIKTLMKVIFKVLIIVAALFMGLIAWFESTGAVTITINQSKLISQLNSVYPSIHTIIPTGVGSILTLASLSTMGAGVLGFIFGFLKG